MVARMGKRIDIADPENADIAADHARTLLALYRIAELAATDWAPAVAGRCLRLSIVDHEGGGRVERHGVDLPLDRLGLISQPLRADIVDRIAALGKRPPTINPGEFIRKGAMNGKKRATRRRWTTQEKEVLRRRYADAGVTTEMIAAELDRSVLACRQMITKLQLPNRTREGRRPRALRRFDSRELPNPQTAVPLAADHPAPIERRTMYPKTVTDPARSKRVLVSGMNSRKLGSKIVKGAWRGFPIYALTLEERATCPTSCFHWRTCYGNAMHLARRHRHGPELEAILNQELAVLSRAHPEGFAVRLHILGDFYSVDYVELWRQWIETLSNLHVFGFTAWTPDNPIGAAITDLNELYPNRFAIRWSSDHKREFGATTIFRPPGAAVVAEGIVCPAQTGATESCGTCAYAGQRQRATSRLSLLRTAIRVAAPCRS